jgi:hypothetical protein
LLCLLRWGVALAQAALRRVVARHVVSMLSLSWAVFWALPLARTTL